MGTFAERWTEKERACGREEIATAMVRCGDDFLPREAAPGLSFEQASSPLPLWEVFGVVHDWSETERMRLARYRVIGSDGAGNPICLKVPLGEVVLLDHEVRFRTEEFVNRSVRHLAECMLAYMGERDPERFRKTVAGIDPSALAAGSFWSCEAELIGQDD